MAMASVEGTAYLARMIVREEVSRLLAGAFSAIEAGDCTCHNEDEWAGITREQLTALTDVELVRAFWAAADRVPAETHRDQFYAFIGEALERWAPEAEWAVREEEWLEGDDDLEDQRACWEERRKLRQAARRT
jgi:hypothetical protein